MKRVLSTKILSSSQRELLLNSGLSFVEYNAISVKFCEFDAPPSIKNAIVTSQNAVHSLLSKNHSIENYFCVGEKTKILLEENGQNVIEMAENASKLAYFIQKRHKNELFYFFCSNLRRVEIPELLSQEQVQFREIQTYTTQLVEKKFKQEWEGILFFSPSGVESFTAVNSIGQATAFCIGTTTAKALEKHTSNIVVSNATTVESVIAKTVKTLLHHA